MPNANMLYNNTNIIITNNPQRHHRHNSRRRLAQLIARRKLLHSSSSSSSSSSSDIVGTTTPTLLHRPPPSLNPRNTQNNNNNYITPTSRKYTIITFLTPDTIIAADNAGLLDIIRIPRHHHHYRDQQQQQQRQQQHLLTTITLPDHTPPLSLTPLHNGSQCACLSPSGTVHHYDLVTSPPTLLSTHHAPRRRYHRAWIPFRADNVSSPDDDDDDGGEEEAWSLLFPSGSAFPAPLHASFVSESSGGRWGGNHHHRRRRRRCLDTFSRRALPLLEIEGWRSPGTLRTAFAARRRTSSNVRSPPRGHGFTADATAASWREDRPGLNQSCLCLAHVDIERDCFYARTFDRRTTTSKDAVCACVVGIDVDSRDDGFLGRMEDVTAVAYGGGDNEIVTAHVSTVYGREEEGRRFDTVLKWWDWRKMVEDDGGDETKRRQRQHRRTPVASFPLDDVCGMTCDRERGMDDGENDYAIVGLTGAVHGGTIMAQMVTETGRKRACLLDAGTGRILRTMEGGPWRALATTPQLDFVACGGDEEMLLFDWARHNCSARDGRDRGVKRSREDEEDGMKRKDCVGRLAVELLDQYELKSEMCCMAMDDLGTTVVCGSEDGDLYVWRGF